MNVTPFAKNYAERGWQVFPLKPKDKVPVVKWADVATSEVNMAVGWFDNDPNANIAIATGKRSGIVVIDIDAEHGGYDSLMALQDEHGPLPVTPVARTGGGGEHLFFAYPTGLEIRNSASKLAHGIDIRGEGGYVVAAPSIHPNGSAYEWANDQDLPLAPLPEWVIRKLSVNPEPIPAHTNGKIANGSRNATLASLAGSMRKRGMETDTIELALQDHNRKHCLPPLTEDEVRAIAISIGRYEPKQEPQIEIVDAGHAMDDLEMEIKRRQADPREVWGLHYAWPRLSKATGGKQLGEFTIIAGEPGIGKSYWAHQDALMTAIGEQSEPVPTALWCGEMKRRQTSMRMCAILGVSKYAMKTGYMTAEDWQKFNEANALIRNSPLYIYDAALNLTLDTMDKWVEREVGEHGTQNVVLDYDWLIPAKGDSEIETSQNISRACKVIAQKYNVSLILISSVSKAGMDSASDTTAKSHVSGSGKKLHDADNVFMLTKFKEGQSIPRFNGAPIAPVDYWHLSTLHFAKGRELDDVAGDKMHFYRPDGPRFYEIDPAPKGFSK